MKTRRAQAAVLWAAVVSIPLAGAGDGAARAADPPGGPPKLTAQIHNSAFELARDTFNGLSAASDGKIYYVLGSQSVDIGAQMYCYDPAAKKIRHLGDVTEACGEKGMKTIVQGTSHVNFVESQGKLYFATHVGHYSYVDGMKKMPEPPPGYKPYPGGHLLAYDMAAAKFDDLAIAPLKEGILTMNMDVRRGRLFGLTWPTGHFFRYDLTKNEMKDFGPTAGQGEDGQGPTYRTICRSIAVNPEDGSAYFTLAAGTILRYVAERDALETVAGDDLRKDYFGQYDVTSPATMAYNWRQTIWYPAEKMIYGVHGNSGYLFRFDPRAGRIDVLDRITSESSKRSGMFDQFNYGYLGFTLGPDNRTLYYLTGGPVYVAGKRVTGKGSAGTGEAKGIEDLHLVTYAIPAAKWVDHGAIYFPNGERPNHVNSIAVGKDGTVYPVAGFRKEQRANRPDQYCPAEVTRMSDAGCDAFHAPYKIEARSTGKIVCGPQRWSLRQYTTRSQGEKHHARDSCSIGRCGDRRDNCDLVGRPFGGGGGTPRHHVQVRHDDAAGTSEFPQRQAPGEHRASPDGQGNRAR